MNKLLLINGSPRTGSNSGKMLERFARAASKFNIATETIELRTFNLQMCRGCLACFKTGHCVHQDGLNELMTRIENTSGVVLASPVYYGSDRPAGRGAWTQFARKDRRFNQCCASLGASFGSGGNDALVRSGRNGSRWLRLVFCNQYRCKRYFI